MNVCVVGNSPHLLESEHGSTIDSYDIVIRCNRFITNGYEKHVGTKTDYAVVNCHFIKRNKSLSKFFRKWNHKPSWPKGCTIVSKDVRVSKTYKNEKTVNYAIEARTFASQHKLPMGTMAVGPCAILFAYEHLNATTVSCYGFTRRYKGKCRHYFEKVSNKKITHNHERELQLMVDLYGVKFYE